LTGVNSSSIEADTSIESLNYEILLGV